MVVLVHLMEQMKEHMRVDKMAMMKDLLWVARMDKTTVA